MKRKTSLDIRIEALVEILRILCHVPNPEIIQRHLSRGKTL